MGLESWRNLQRRPVEASDNEVECILDDALEQVESVKIRYFGGSSPGATRDITPGEFYCKDSRGAKYLEAYCHLSDKVKSFRIDLIQIDGVNRVNVDRPGSTLRRHRSPRDFQAAKRHIREGKEFSAEMGGLDSEVKAYFFGLGEDELDEIMDEYGREYGGEREAYARDVFDEWQMGARQMSGLVAKRLFSFLPPRMPLETKYELAEKVWEHFGPKSRHSYVIGKSADMSSVAERVADKLSDVVKDYSVPLKVGQAFEWLSQGDVETQTELLNYFRAQEKRLAIEKIEGELPILQRQVAEHGNVIHLAKSVLTVGKHEIELWIDGGYKGEIVEGRPRSERLGTSAVPVLKWVLGLIAIGALIAIQFYLDF